MRRRQEAGGKEGSRRREAPLQYEGLGCLGLSEAALLAHDMYSSCEAPTAPCHSPHPTPPTPAESKSKSISQSRINIYIDIKLILILILIPVNYTD